MNILVTGGAGYIGAHTVKLLQEQGHKVTVLDKLFFGNFNSLPDKIIRPVDVNDEHYVEAILISERIELVMHFAAFLLVPESKVNPLKYYHNNVAGTLSLLHAMRRCSINKFVFSSSCAVYGQPATIPVTINTPTNPCNPYAKSKLIVEEVLRECDWLNFITLRYFNVLGSGKNMGENATAHKGMLLPSLFNVALGKEDIFTIYGTNLATPDGTCIRDYIHVLDVADAHVKAAKYLERNKASLTMNLASGQGYSVKQILEKTREVTSHPIPNRVLPQRDGDAQVIYALREPNILGWEPYHSDLDSMIASSWQWYKSKNA